MLVFKSDNAINKLFLANCYVLNKILNAMNNNQNNTNI